MKTKTFFFYKFLKNRNHDSSGIPPLTNKQAETITNLKGKAEVLNERYNTSQFLQKK